MTCMVLSKTQWVTLHLGLPFLFRCSWLFIHLAQWAKLEHQVLVNVLLQLHTQVDWYKVYNVSPSEPPKNSSWPLIVATPKWTVEKWACKAMLHRVVYRFTRATVIDQGPSRSMYHCTKSTGTLIFSQAFSLYYSYCAFFSSLVLEWCEFDQFSFCLVACEANVWVQNEAMVSQY